MSDCRFGVSPVTILILILILNAIILCVKIKLFKSLHKEMTWPNDSYHISYEVFYSYEDTASHECHSGVCFLIDVSFMFAPRKVVTPRYFTSDLVVNFWPLMK